MLSRGATVVIDAKPGGLRWANLPARSPRDCPVGDPAGHPATADDASHHRLQRLIADLASRFITIEADRIDAGIAAALREMGELLHLDRTILWKKTADAGSVIVSHAWVREGQKALPALPAAAFPVVAPRLKSGHPVWFNRLDDLAPADREAFEQHGLRAAALIPVVLGRTPAIWGALACSSTTREITWTADQIEQLRFAAGVFGQALARKNDHLELEQAHAEVGRLRRQARRESGQPRPAHVEMFRVSFPLVAESPALRQALAQVEQVASTPATVLLLGETGVGKEVFARAIHELSPRKAREMVRVNCAAIPHTLIESELFGHERGAYTGALTRQIGRFEAADRSTLFLDEIGDLSADMQVKLLRVLQDHIIERLGSTQSIKIDVRIIAATNQNIERAVEDKSFREDLFYRLNVFPIVIPPLRQRAEDIPALVWQFIGEYSKAFGKQIEAVSEESMRQLQAYSWPGNVRELRNLVERAVICANGPELVIPLPARAAVLAGTEAMTLRSFQIQHIRATLDSTNWRIRGSGGAAERLGLKPTTLETRMAKLGLFRPRPQLA